MRRRRKVGQLGFSDIPVTRRGNGSNDALSQIDRLVDWAAVERLLSGVHSSSRGEPAFPHFSLIKESVRCSASPPGNICHACASTGPATALSTPTSL